MWHNTLGRTGSRVSALACGSNALRFYDAFTAEIAFNYALDHGITFIETGRMYNEGKTEQWIGKAVSHRRSEYVLASKCSGRDSYEDAARKIDLSLEALQTDHIDHYRVAAVDSHEVLAQALAPDGAQRAIEEAREAGKISYTGITGHQPEVLMAALETGRFDTMLFVLNMVTYNEQNRRLIQLAADLGVGTMVMRPLDHGALCPDPALRFALASGVDTVLCGMYSPLEIDTNLAFAGAEPERSGAGRPAPGGGGVEHGVPALPGPRRPALHVPAGDRRAPDHAAEPLPGQVRALARGRVPVEHDCRGGQALRRVYALRRAVPGGVEHRTVDPRGSAVSGVEPSAGCTLDGNKKRRESVISHLLQKRAILKLPA